MKEYLRMKDAFWCKIRFGNHGVRCFIEGSDPPWQIDFWDAKTARYASHAINEHDDLVETIKEQQSKILLLEKESNLLRELLREAIKSR